MSSPLHKTTIIVWSGFDPTELGNELELEELAREATVGSAYCSSYGSVLVEDPANDPDWDGSDFFEEQM